MPITYDPILFDPARPADIAGPAANRPLSRLEPVPRLRLGNTGQSRGGDSRQGHLKRQCRLWHQYGIRQARPDPHRRTSWELQTTLVLSHSTGTAAAREAIGAPGPLPQGDQPGARLLRRPPRRDRALLALVNAGSRPHIPAKGSVGASGDLAPLAHMRRP